LVNKTGNKNNDPIIAIIIDKDVKIPKKTVGLKFEVAKTRNPKIIVIEV
jgi:hypothetical protein